MWPSEEIPQGPTAAFDVIENGALFYNEKENSIQQLSNHRSDHPETSKAKYSVPYDLNSTQYYWARLTTVSEKPLRVFAVLKNHTTKNFEFVLLVLRDGQANLVQQSKTQLRPFGYEVNVNQVAHSQYVASFLSRKENKKFTKGRRSSDRELFKQQVTGEQQITPESSCSSEDYAPAKINASRTQSLHSETLSNQENGLIIEKPKLDNNFWSVMMKICFPVPDRMDVSLIPFRKAKLSFKVRAPSLDRPLPIKLNLLTRFSMDAEIRGPVILKDRAYFLTKSSPPTLLEAETTEEENIGYFSGLPGLRFMRMRKNVVSAQGIPTQGNPPSSSDDSIWSNLQILDGILFLAALNDYGQISAFSLNLNKLNALEWEEHPVMDRLSDDYDTIQGIQIRVHQRIHQNREPSYQLGLRFRANRNGNSSDDQFFALPRIELRGQ